MKRYWRIFQRARNRVEIYVYPLGFDLWRSSGGPAEKVYTRLFQRRSEVAAPLEALIAETLAAGYEEVPWTPRPRRAT